MSYEIVIVIVTLSSIIFGYLSGNVLYSVIIGKLFFKKDLRDFESKNAGATNSLRVYGKFFAFIILLFDVLKSFLPSIILWLIFKNTIDEYMLVNEGFNTYSLVFLSGLFAVIGHCYPAFFKFKGGKGVSCYSGFVLSVVPFVGIVCLLIFIIIYKLYKYVSLSSILTSFAPIMLVFVPGLNFSFMLNIPIDVLLVADIGIYWVLFVSILFLISSGILIYKHKDNITRLINGTERKMSKKSA